jgi:hypothetical protein
MEPYKPEFTFDLFAERAYYNVLAERESYNQELITFDQFLDENGKWLYDYYERLLSEQ